MPILPKLPLGVIAIEAVYSSIVFIMCFTIFYKIRKVYKITDYRGFYLFSNTFLYLGLAYFLRFCVSALAISGEVLNLEFSFSGIRGLVLFSLTFMIYSSSAAILYLIFSLIWKWVNKAGNDLYTHLIAIVIAILPIAWKSAYLFIIPQIVLLIALVLAILVNYVNRDSKVFNQIYVIYILMVVFWILNLSLLFRAIPIKFKGLIYVFSLLTLGLITYKVFRKL